MENKMAVFQIFIMLLEQSQPLAISSQVEIKPGPKSGILIKEAPGLILTERKIISQTFYVSLDPERTLSKKVNSPLPKDKDAYHWYNSHMNRTRENVVRMIEQLEKTFVPSAGLGTKRPRRFAASLISLAVVTVLGLVVGTSMSAANSVSIAKFHAHSDNLKSNMAYIRDRLRDQNNINEQFVEIINETIIIQGQHADLIGKSIELHQKWDTYWQFQYKIQEPLNFLTQEYLRELQASVSSVIKGNIPLYLVSLEDVRKSLSQLHHLSIDTTQLRIALEMGSSVPLMVDSQKMQIAYMLNLPLVLPEKVYQTKRVINVGVWQQNAYMKVTTPDLVAFQSWSDNVNLVPNLDNCKVFKDLNYLCPGTSFLPEMANAGCGITHPEDSINKCEVTISYPDIFSFNTVALLVDRRWLVSTALTNMTVTYARHGTFKVLPLEYSTFLLTVPKDVIVTIGSQALFYVSGDDAQENLELIHVFDQEKLSIDPSLDYLLSHKANHTMT